MSRRVELLTVLLLSSAAPCALAAETAREADALNNSVDTIVVTAQKIEQSIVDVPITVSVASGERMRELGVSDLDELSNYVPGLNIQEQSANNPGVVIRGITSDSGSAQQAARVTLYYNGVDISRSRGSYQDLYDIERIEVIKGPQATLFGTASAIGAISILSAKPKEGFEGELTASLGNFGARVLSGHLNAGTDVLAGRIAFAWKTRDGYVENLSDTQGDLYAQDQRGVRASLRYTPSDAFKADLVFTYDGQRNSGTPFISGTYPTSTGPADPFGAANLSGSPLSKAVLGAEELGLVRNVYDANLSLDWNLSDRWTMTMVNGYRNFDSNEVFDADGTAAWFLEFAEDAKGWQASHETRFTYSGENFRSSAGWNLFREDGRQRVPFSTEEGTYLQCLANLIPALGCIAADGSPSAAQATGFLTGGLLTAIPYSFVFENNGRNDSYSLFADGTWIATPELELTAGLRLLFEDRQSGFVTTVPNSVLTGGLLIPGIFNTGGETFKAEDQFTAFLPRVNALYHFSSDVSAFATVSKGRRSATVSLSSQNVDSVVTPRLTPIAAENVWNYEVGIKGARGMVSGSLGVYYQSYDNFQVNVIENGISVTRSAGAAKNLGFEAEIDIAPTDWLNIFANAGYISGGIDDRQENGAFAGHKFRLQPEVQAAAGFTIDAPLTENVRFFATPSVTYRSRIYFEVPNSDAISQDAVTLVNLRAGLSINDGRIEIAGFARNLTDENYLLDAGNTGGAFGIATFIPAEPRLYGVQVTGRF